MMMTKNSRTSEKQRQQLEKKMMMMMMTNKQKTMTTTTTKKKKARISEKESLPKEWQHRKKKSYTQNVLCPMSPCLRTGGPLSHHPRVNQHLQRQVTVTMKRARWQQLHMQYVFAKYDAKNNFCNKTPLSERKDHAVVRERSRQNKSRLSYHRNHNNDPRDLNLAKEQARAPHANVELCTLHRARCSC